MKANNKAAPCVGRPLFDVALVKINVEAGDEAFAATIKQVPGTPYEMPNIQVGACIALEVNGETTHIGIATDVSAPGNHPKCSTRFYPLLKASVFSKHPTDYAGGLPKRAMRYLVEVTSDEGHCFGNFTKLNSADAEHLLAQLGPLAPSELLEVFWGEAEIAAIAANFEAQERYAEKASTLLESF